MNLLDNLHSIFNCDESGFPFNTKPGKVIGVKKMKQLDYATSGDKSQVTVLACVSAAGPPIKRKLNFIKMR